MKRDRDRTAWRDTAKGLEKYKAAREDAQRRANETGYDHGIEPSDYFEVFQIFLLPMKKNRQGFELRCEVVHCSDLSKCQPGHGPSA